MVAHCWTSPSRVYVAAYAEGRSKGIKVVRRIVSGYQYEATSHEIDRVSLLFVAKRSRGWECLSSLLETLYRRLERY